MKMSTVLTVAAGLALSAGAAMGQSLQFCSPFTPGTPAIPATPGTLRFNWSGILDSSDLTFRPVNEGNGNELAPAGPFAYRSATVTNVVRYEAFTFVAPNTETLDFFSATAFDGWLTLYQGTFDPSNSLTNVVASDDDLTVLNGGVVPNRNGVPNGTFPDAGFRFAVTAGTSYTVVTQNRSIGTGTPPTAPNNNFYNEVRATDGTPAVPAVPGSPNFNIPDNSMTGVSIDLVIANTDIIQSVDSVQLKNLVHTWMGDLVITLTHVETGTTAELIDRVGRTTTSGFGNSGDLNGNYSIVDGGAAWPATAAIAPGTYTQFSNGTAGESLAGGNPLSVFVGESLAGTWRLTVKDLGSGDTGSISAFCLNVTVPAPGSLALLGLGGLVATRRRR